jgi:hypothetical protein
VKVAQADSRLDEALELYKARTRIEQGFGRLKRFKRVALRCEKTARNFRSIASFAAGLCLIKFVHTAYWRHDDLQYCRDGRPGRSKGRSSSETQIGFIHFLNERLPLPAT